MAKKEYYYNVKNRSAGVVIYRIPEDNVRRHFAVGETKRISYTELLHLSYQPGGRQLMANFLQIQSEGATRSLNIKTEPEYYMNEQQIVALIKNGSLDQFLDCLDYAPIGVIDLIKKYSVEIPLSDYDKRQALKEKTGFDVDAAIQNSGEEPAAAAPAETSTAPTGRRTTTNYKIVNKRE